jgi:hypothetical protein
MTVTEFLAWEERQELRWEFDGFQAVAMTGGTMAHEVIGDNIRFYAAKPSGERSLPCSGANAKDRGCGSNPLPGRLRSLHTDSATFNRSP